MHLKTRVTLGVATVGAAIATALVPATSAFAAPALALDWPGKAAGYNVQDGMTVTASGTGFAPNTQVFVSECSTNDSNPANCDQTPADGGVNAGMTDANGAFSVGVVARIETLGSASCKAGAACYFGATTNPSAPDATNSALQTFNFDRLQVAPRTNLKNGQNVQVSGGGFNPNTTVYVSECTSADPSKATQACDFNSIKTFTTDANGDFPPGPYPVHTGQVGSDGSKCNPGGGCIIAATDNVVNPATGNIGGAQVQFAALKVTKTSLAGPTHVAKNTKFALKAKVTSGTAVVAGIKVTLYKVTSSGLNKLAAKSTNSSGVAKFGGLTQKRTTKYEAKTSANSTYAGSTSKVHKVATP